MIEDASACDFSLEHYDFILKKALQEGYSIQSLEQYFDRPLDPVLLLRHDVDVSIQYAGRMAEIEHRAGVRSTIFIRVHAAEYNPFSRQNYQCLRWLTDEGFEIGLHHEVGVFPLPGSTPREQLQRELTVLTAVLERKVRAATVHLPKHVRYTLDPSEFADLGIEYEGGAALFNEGGVFMSDSNRLKKPECLCRMLGKAPKILSTTHPVWWNRVDEDVDRMRSFLLGGN